MKRTPRIPKVRTAESVDDVDALEVRANVELYRAAQAEALRPDEVGPARARRDELLDQLDDLRRVAADRAERQHARGSWSAEQKAALEIFGRASEIRNAMARGIDPAEARAEADRIAVGHGFVDVDDAMARLGWQISEWARDPEFNRAIELRARFEYRGRRLALDVLVGPEAPAPRNLLGVTPTPAAGDHLAVAIAALHADAQAADQAVAEAEARVSNVRFRELITALRCGRRNGWARVADLLRAIDHVVNPDAPGPLVRDYVTDWKDGGRQRLAHALGVAASRSSQ